MLQQVVVSGAIDLAARAGNAIADGAADAAYGVGKMMKGQNLVSIANMGRVEPLTLVDADVANLDYISDVMQSALSMFAGYYLQAINMLNSVGNVAVAERLKPLNPSSSFGFEEHQQFKPTYFGLKNKKEPRHVALESVTADVKIDDYKEISASANLSVGKMYKIVLNGGSNDKKVEVPVAIRLMVNILPSSILSEFFTYRDSFDMSMKERWHAWREGRLEFVKDLILCNDLIDKYRRMAITDKSGLGQTILNRETSQVVKALKGHESYATASNIAVISEETLAMIEAKLNGRFSNSKIRETMFENSNLMLLLVVDKQWDRVTVYTRGIDASTTLSAKEMKSSGKGNGPDVAEIMKAYMMGSSPQNY